MGRSIHDETMEWVRVVLLSIEQTSGMNRLWETQHRRCDDGEQTALEEERRIVSGMEVSSWVGRDLRIGWCVEEKERGGERRGGRREGMNLSLSTTPHQLPCGAYTLRGYTLQTHYHSTPIHRTQTQKWGIPTSSPPGEREEKEEEKGTFYTYYPLFFSLGENPQTPPSNWDAQEKDKKSEGAR